MIYDLQNEVDRVKFKDYVNRLYANGEIVELKKVDFQRTKSQNNYMHLLIRIFACHFGYREEEVKQEYFKRACNYQLFHQKVVRPDGKIAFRMRSTSELSKDEMIRAIDSFKNWSAMEAEFPLPDAEDKRAIAEAMKLVEENISYM